MRTSSGTVLQPFPLFLVQSDNWYTWYKYQGALYFPKSVLHASSTLAAQYYRAQAPGTDCLSPLVQGTPDLYCRSTVLPTFYESTSTLQHCWVKPPGPGTFRHLVHLVQASVRPCIALIQYYRLLVLPIYFLYFNIRLMTTCDLCQLDLNLSDFVLKSSRPKFDSCRGYTTPPVIPLLAS